MKNEKINYFRIDFYLILIHVILLSISYIIYCLYPTEPNSKNLILLLFLFIAVCEIIPILFIIAIVLPHLDTNIKYVKIKKIFLIILYFISSFFILTFIGISSFLNENVFIHITTYTSILFISIYFSIIRFVKLTKDQYLFIISILIIFLLFIL